MRVDSTGPPLISVWDFNGVKDYFRVLQYGAIDCRDVKGLFHKKNTGPWQIYDTGPYTILYGKINGATVNFTTGRGSFPGPIFL